MADNIRTYRAEGQEVVRFDDGEQLVWDVIRDDNDEWICLSDPASTALVVLSLNSLSLRERC